MNEEIILSMARPYIKNSEITYADFDNIYKMLSVKEQYEVTEILLQNGVNFVDENKKSNKEPFVLESDLDETDFEILYDESIFKDNRGESFGEEDEVIELNYDIRQSNDILCHLIQEENKQAVQDLCIKNKRLVDKYVISYQKRYGNRLDFEDLEQVGFIGLIKAAKKFDFQKGTAFSTYAVYWIKQAISREIMDNGFVIRIPVHMMERIVKVIQLDNKLVEKEKKLSKRIKQISVDLGITEKEVRECLVLRNNFLSYTSLNVPVGVEEETELCEFIADDESDSVEDKVYDLLLHEQLEEVLRTLTDREEKVLRLRYGFEDGRTHTLEEIGKKYNLTRERIRQIEAKALRKIKRTPRSNKIVDFLD